MLMLLRFCASLVTPFQALWTADTSDWEVVLGRRGIEARERLHRRAEAVEAVAELRLGHRLRLAEKQTDDDSDDERRLRPA
jgi:hypothetical protein